MIFIRSHAASLLTALIAVLWGCSTGPAVSSSETPNGNCIGKIKDGLGTPVVGASVLLVSEKYSPLPGEGGGAIDSAISDRQGRFGFDVKVSGTYNLLAKAAAGSVMHTAIRIDTGGRQVLDDAILRAPGSLSGEVRFRPAPGKNPAIVLLVGTNSYALPSDSSGRFSFSSLAPGSYRLRALVPAGGFAAAETTAVVPSDGNVDIGPLVLAGAIKPVVQRLEVRYDSAMMAITLSWPRVDESLISGYRLFQGRALHPEPVAELGASCSTLTIDAIDTDADTFTYQMCAIGCDKTEGPTIDGNILVRSAPFSLVRAVTLQIPGRFVQKIGEEEFSIDKDRNLYVAKSDVYDYIGKYESSGRLAGSFNSTDTNAHFGGFVRADDKGDMYVLGSIDTYEVMFKFDRTFKPLDTLPFGRDGYFSRSFAVLGNGSVVLFAAKSTDTESATHPLVITHAVKYAPNFIKEKDVVFRNVFVSGTALVHDSIVCCVYDEGSTKNAIIYLDSALNIVRRFEDWSFLDGMIPAPYSSPAGMLCHVSGDIFTVRAFKNWMDESAPGRQIKFLDVFFSGRGRIVARVVYPVNKMPLGYDGQGNIYCPGGENSLAVYSSTFLGAASGQ
jgi:hypothetical protein